MSGDSEIQGKDPENSGQDLAQENRVGFCKPPESGRFKKGISGNPRGRPKGSVNIATVLMRTLREKVVINEHGRRKTVTKLEAALKQLVNKAASGDLRALQHLVVWASDAEQKHNLAASQDHALNDLDQEVMQRILNRFQTTGDGLQNPEENTNGND